MAVQVKPITVEEFWEIAQQPEHEDHQLELIEGVIEEMPPSSYLNAMIAATVASFLTVYAREHHLGFVTGADGGYALSPKTVLIPDVAFVTRERVSSFVEKVFPGAPDLAVEVISPNETHPQVLRKVRRTVQAGTRLVWAVYPEDQTVNVYRLLESGELAVQTVGLEDSLKGGEVLPGLTLPLRDIFPQG
jgi:Uma2 family endonuclease